MSKYIVTIRRSDNLGTEEYDGGNTIDEARKEAAFFVAHTPAHVRVAICTHDARGLWLREVVRDGGGFAFI